MGLRNFLGGDRNWKTMNPEEKRKRWKLMNDDSMSDGSWKIKLGWSFLRNEVFLWSKIRNTFLEKERLRLERCIDISFISPLFLFWSVDERKKIEEDVIYCDVRVSFPPRRLKTLRSEEQKAQEHFAKIQFIKNRCDINFNDLVIFFSYVTFLIIK